MSTFGAQVIPPFAEYENATRCPPPLCVRASFHPTKTRPAELITIVGSTWKLYPVPPEFTRTFVENGGAGGAGGGPPRAGGGGGRAAGGGGTPPRKAVTRAQAAKGRINRPPQPKR